MKKKILFVDDEPIILESIRRMLRPMRQEWDMEFAKNAEEALRVLEIAPYDLLVTDMRMPGMDGAQLLAEVKKRHPETVRIILSGQTDKNAFLRSARLAHQFLCKPCDSDTLRNTINRTYRLRKFLANPEVQRLVARIETIPSLPQLYTELTEAVESSDASLEQVGQIISKDMGMTAQILHLANSAFFGIRQKVADPSQAVQILGLDIIQALILSFHVFSAFKRVEESGLSLDRLWKHSLAVGEFARKIAWVERAGPEILTIVFISGVLHDVGKLVLAANLPGKYRETLSLAKNEQIEHWRAETETLNASHAEVGAYLMGIWGLPDPVVEAITYHHCPSQCMEKSFSPLTATHVANVLEHELGGGEMEWPNPSIDEDYLKELGLLDRLPVWRDHYPANASI